MVLKKQNEILMKFPRFINEIELMSHYLWNQIYVTILESELILNYLMLSNWIESTQIKENTVLKAYLKLNYYFNYDKTTKPFLLMKFKHSHLPTLLNYFN